MGFFDMFKKQECTLCGGKASPLSRKKLKDGNYVCKNCLENVSAFLDISVLTKEELEEHIEYMKKQDILYKNEFEKTEKREAYGLYKIIFADSIGMFELSRDAAKKKKYRELFRYDLIEKYEPYFTEHKTTDPDDKLVYKNAGVKIYLYCSNPIISKIPNLRDVDKDGHKYVRELDMRVSNGVKKGDVSRIERKVENVVREFDKTFGVDTVTTVFGGRFSQKDKRQMQAGAEIAKGLGKAAKGVFTGEGAKEGLDEALGSVMDIASGDRTKYKKLADEAEERAWKE